MTGSLWAIPQINQFKTPISIVREQSNELVNATGGVLQGRINSMPAADLMRFTLDIIAPALNFYIYTFITFEHNLTEIYPVKVYSIPHSAWSTCNNEHEFVNNLRSILASREANAVLVSLIAQSTN